MRSPFDSRHSSPAAKSPIETLFAEADKHGLRRIPEIRDLIEMIQNDPDDDNVIELLREKIEEEKELQLSNPDPFRKTAPHSAAITDGDCTLGKIVQTGFPYRVPSQMLVQHALFLGRAGGGKTTTIKRLLQDLLPLTPAPHVLILERKREFTELARLNLASPFQVINSKRLRINLLRPPPGINHQMWLSILTQLMVDHLDILTASSALITDLAMKMLNESGVLADPSLPHPNLRDLHKYIRAQKFSVMTHEARFQETSLNRISALLTMLPGIFECDQGFDVSRMIHENVLLLLHDIPNLTIANFLVACLSAQYFLYRVIVEGHQPRLKNLVVLDEASSLFRRIDEVREKPSHLAYMVSQARAYGIGLVAASQSAVDLSNMLLANTSFKILVGGFEQGKDFQEFINTRDTTPEQEHCILRHREPGHAYVSDPRYPYIGECAIAWPHLPPPLTDAEIEQRSVATAAAFGWDSGASTVARAASPKPAADKSPDISTHDATPKSQQNVVQPDGKSTEDVSITVLKDIEARPFVTLRQRAKDLKIVLTVLKNILARLESDDWIIHYNVHGHAGRPRHLYEVTEQGYQKLAKNKPVQKGKGGYLHQFYQTQVSDYYRSAGHEIEIEGRAGDKNVDIIARKLPDGETFAIEIELHVKENSHWQENILLDLASSRISRVLCLVPDKESLEFLTKNMAAASGLSAVKSRVTIDLLRKHMRFDENED